MPELHDTPLPLPRVCDICGGSVSVNDWCGACDEVSGVPGVDMDVTPDHWAPCVPTHPTVTP